MVLRAEILGPWLNELQCFAFADKPYDLQNLISWVLMAFPPKFLLLESLPRRLSKEHIPIGIMKPYFFFFAESIYTYTPPIDDSLMSKF